MVAILSDGRGNLALQVVLRECFVGGAPTEGRGYLPRPCVSLYTPSFVGVPYSLRRSVFSTLPIAFRGSSPTIAMYWGALNDAS